MDTRSSSTADALPPVQLMATTNAMPIPQLGGHRNRNLLLLNDQFGDLFDDDATQSSHLHAANISGGPMGASGTMAGDLSHFAAASVAAVNGASSVASSSSSQTMLPNANAPMLNNSGPFVMQLQGSAPAAGNVTMWNAIGDALAYTKQEPYRMDDDDIFQVDKNDLFQGPTLAELNDDTILEDLNIDDYILQTGGDPAPADNRRPSPMLGMQMQMPQQMHGMQMQHDQQQHMQYVQQHHHQQHQQLNLLLQQQQMQPNSPGSPATLQDLNAMPFQDSLFDMPLFGQSTPHQQQHQQHQQQQPPYQTSTPTHSVLSRDTLSPHSQASSTHSSQLLLNSSVSPPLVAGFNSMSNALSHSNSNSSGASTSSGGGGSQQQPLAKYSTLQELLRKDSRAPGLGQSVPGPSVLHAQHHHIGAIRNVNLHQTQQRSLLGQRQQLQQHQHQQQMLSPSEHGLAGPAQQLHQLRLLHPQLTAASRLSSSAPSTSAAAAHVWDVAREQMWARREPRPHLLSTGSVAEAESVAESVASSASAVGGIVSPEPNEFVDFVGHDFSQDEGYDDSDENYEDYDTESDDSDTEEIDADGADDGGACAAMGGLSGGGGAAARKAAAAAQAKKERFFWQYNVQSKGPKGTRLVIKTNAEDPHVLNEVTDPVFSSNCSVRGIKVIKVKHSGKARKGDGNDLTPNPRKLHAIGRELDKLGRIINDMTPVAELPMNVRPKSRKEKNKLASRACRLKKKAQHEANKIKRHGLEIEHKRLLDGLDEIKRMLVQKYANPNAENADELNAHIESVAQTSTQLSIAGTSTEFVNGILEKVKAGIPSGGLEDI